MRAEYPVTISPTRVESAAACERKHFISDIVEFGKEKNVAAAFGNVLHAGHGGWWSGLEFDKVNESLARDKGLAAMAAEYARANLEGRDERYPLSKAEMMFDAYISQSQRVGPFTGAKDWSVLSIEDRVKLPVGEHILSFAIDRSFVNMESRHAIVLDLKTVTRPDNKWRTKWYRSLQMKLYKFGAKSVYDFADIDFVIEGLDKNAKPKIHVVMLPQWSQAMLDEAVTQFHRMADADHKLIAQALDSEGNVDIMRLEEIAVNETKFNYDNCEMYGATCAFDAICRAEPDERAALLRAEYHEVINEY